MARSETLPAGEQTPEVTSISEKDIKVDFNETAQQLENKTFKDYILISCLCFMVAFGGFVFGYDTGTISGFVNMTDFIDRFGEVGPDGEKFMSSIRVGLMIGLFNVACAIGGIVLSKIGDIKGRRIGLMFAMAIYVAGIAVQISAQDKWYQITIGRIITGFSVGTVSVISPMFIGESSPKAVRGTLVCCFQLCITLGIFIGYCCTYGTKQLNNSLQWRIPLALCFLWAGFLVVGMMFMPESPRFLVEKKRIEDAKKSIARSNKMSPEDPFVYAELQLIQAGIDREQMAGSATWGELITGKPAVFRRVIMGICLASLQQLTGNNYFFYFATTIFKAVGLQDSFQTSMILGCVNFLSTFVNIWAIERFGRRLCLLVGAAGMFVCFIIYSTLGSVALYQYDGESNLPAGRAMIFVTCLYIFFFASTWAGGVYCVLSESYPLRVRSKAMALALGSNWLWGFLISFTSSFIINAINFYYGYVFTGCIAVAFVFTYFFIMETKGLSLEEVDELYAQKILPWKSGSWVPPTAEEMATSTGYAKPSQEHV
ncbi:sugar transporter 1 [Spathaspora passalidarum NRRL Y-27907]|uniref:Sugar transporter 1 n=1 Tax=Spathaspora passalidarum (strain NRRL Y-27907 / 11-Y1) TaxID=619300 RepID=G3ALW7_SPAPN|nr:sugar transporter 1 [Spathaspora passalidarum NRRL Y-27907]EGW33320.1 sugar transporter 1 [Spathaspora passalidarum NRRL Y-27907]